MLTRQELRRIAQARLRDAEVLFGARRYDGASYLCGYALELALKARICATLRWTEFPESGAEFHGLQSFRTHDLDMLLRMSGRNGVRTSHAVDWSTVQRWSPEARYAPIGSATRDSTGDMISAVKRLMRAL
jgi:HEPN domain-containing protein